MTHPSFDSPTMEKVFVIGCKYCASPNQQWIVGMTENKKIYCKCANCAHIVKLSLENIGDKPVPKPMDMRFFT